VPRGTGFVDGLLYVRFMAAEYRIYDNWVEEREEDDDWTDYESERDYLRQWLKERTEFFGEQATHRGAPADDGRGKS